MGKFYIPKGYRRLRLGERLNLSSKYWFGMDVSLSNLKCDGKWIDINLSSNRNRWNNGYCIHIMKK